MKDNESSCCLCFGEVKFAGFWRRFAALLIDYAIVISFGLIIGNILNFSGFFLEDKSESIIQTNNIATEKNSTINISNVKSSDAIKNSEQQTLSSLSKRHMHNQNIFNILILTIETLYFTLLIASKKQSTIGQKIMKVMVVSRRKGKMTILHSFIRFIFMDITIQLFGIGFITIPFSKEKATLYDLICNTRLVHSTLETSKEKYQTKYEKNGLIEKKNVLHSKKSIASKTRKKPKSTSKRKTKNK